MNGTFQEPKKPRNKLSAAALSHKSLLLTACLVVMTGCANQKSQSFTFTTDMPPDFTYEAVAQYVPAKGQTCTVKKPHVGYNQRWSLRSGAKYQPDLQIPIYRTVERCPLVIYRLQLTIYATYGKDFGDFATHSAVVATREAFKEEIKGKFDSSGISTFNGHCQLRFRTQGINRRITKSLDCKPIDAHGVITKGHPIGAYTLDQLPGKTVKFKIRLADEERPAIGDTWVKVKNGWKRCMGDNFEDQYAFCFGNYKDFSTFITHDGKQCSIYPGCTE